MEKPHTPLIKVVRAGLEKACRDFSSRVAPLGFARSKKMLWIRYRGDTAECISFLRRGGTYGAPQTASVDIRVSFFIRPAQLSDPGAIQVGPRSDSLRDARGHAYHLRFNARSGSTYDRCLDDLMRVITDHGIPWFASHNP